MFQINVDKFVIALAFSGALAIAPAQVHATSVCDGVPSHAAFSAALSAANTALPAILGNEVWGTIVAADGTVCAVAHTGADNIQSQWPAGRVNSAQKANAANSFSLGNNNGGANAGLTFSTANLWAAAQPGGSLWDLTRSNPVDASTAYSGNIEKFGMANDPMVGSRIGGISTFGGGLALYNSAGDRVGGIGVSGDTACQNHFVAWEVRHNLSLDFVKRGIGPDPDRPDNIIFDATNGFGHPHCLDQFAEAAIAGNLTPVSVPPSAE